MLNAKIADNGHLQFVLEDGSIVDAGNVRGATGPQGTKGIGVKGDPGEPGKQGPAGVGILGFASGYVDAGQFVTLDNIKCTVTTAGNRGLSVASVSGTFQAMISATFGYISGVGGSATNGGSSPTYTTTPSTSFFGWNFPNAGDGSTYLINDITNQRFYRVNLMIGYGYLKNFISIERLY
jgi:hypothetical protein